MKTFRLFGTSVVAVAMALSLASCEDDNDTNDFVIYPDSYGMEYDANGAWMSCYDEAATSFTLDGFIFSRSVSSYEYEGVKYYSWMGFCPSNATDVTDYTGTDWTLHQWSSITGGGVRGKGSAYIVGCWSASEDASTLPAVPACSITYGGMAFEPEDICVTNSTWGYYAMRNGSMFNKKFGAGDWCKLHIIGVRNGVETGRVDVLLADGTKMLDRWTEIDLHRLGVVDMIYFQMSSSDSGAWGMNNPAYFCLDRFEVDLDIK